MTAQIRCAFRRIRRDERGSAIVLVAVAGFALVAIAALAIDIGMLFNSRSEAQRTADAAALAGASAYMPNANGTPVTDTIATAKFRAKKLAADNMIRTTPVDTTLVASSALVDSTQEALIEVIPDSQKVRVTVHRSAIGLWFARVFGVNTWGVSAVAEARVIEAGVAKCMKPFVVPDMWAEGTTDTDANRVQNGSEQWTFDPTQDYYQPYNVDTVRIGTNTPAGYVFPDPNDGTGYGSNWRDGTGTTGDVGRQIDFKYQNPNDKNFVLTPGVFMPWDLPDADGNSVPGGNWYRQNISTCNTNPVSLGKPYPIETGNMVGPTFQGVSDLIDQDPGATWDPQGDTVMGSSFPWKDSPRVVKMALAPPDQLGQPGKQDVTFNNFALFFIEAMDNRHNTVTGRYIGPVAGDEGTTGGSLVYSLRLIK